MSIVGRGAGGCPSRCFPHLVAAEGELRRKSCHVANSMKQTYLGYVLEWDPFLQSTKKSPQKYFFNITLRSQVRLVASDTAMLM